mmetsp:Transcript_15411/g.42644  ORF Transcript_15411/g.42644 Transcript_15411/m.42644 type:complete len:229 (-) Transcript_15411:3233-3919(-)
MEQAILMEQMVAWGQHVGLTHHIDAFVANAADQYGGFCSCHCFTRSFRGCNGRIGSRGRRRQRFACCGGGGGRCRATMLRIVLCTAVAPQTISSRDRSRVMICGFRCRCIYEFGRCCVSCSVVEYRRGNWSTVIVLWWQEACWDKESGTIFGLPNQQRRLQAHPHHQTLTSKYIVGGFGVDFLQEVLLDPIKVQRYHQTRRAHAINVVFVHWVLGLGDHIEDDLRHPK